MDGQTLRHGIRPGELKMDVLFSFRTSHFQLICLLETLKDEAANYIAYKLAV